MKRLLVLLGIAGLMAAAACGDDDDKSAEESKDGGFDAGKPADDAAAQPDTSIAKPVQIENLGDKCQTSGECRGPGATCALTLGDGDLSVDLKDGYCTAVCASTAECGATGGCPLVEATAAIPIQLPGLNLGELLPIPSYCLDKCSRNSAGDCRDGYECKSIADILPAELKTGPAALLLLNQAFRTTYCIPPVEVVLPPPVDASVPADASTAIKLDGGLDAGT